MVFCKKKEKISKTITGGITVLSLALFTFLGSQAKTKNTDLRPHRAFYKISLKKATQDSALANTQGEMILSLKHHCGEWTMDQNSKTILIHKMQPSQEIESGYAVRESDNGRTISFQANRIEDNKSSLIQGAATLGALHAPGRVSYHAPQQTDFSIPAGVVGPVTHLKTMIEKAAAGETSFSSQLFDGSFFGYPIKVNTYVSEDQELCTNKLQRSCPSSAEKLWRMNMAVYSQDPSQITPNFQMVQYYQKDGVMVHYEIDFGTHTIQGDLQKVEYLQGKTCQ